MNCRKPPQDTVADSLERFTAIRGSPNGFLDMFAIKSVNLVLEEFWLTSYRAKLTDFIAKISKNPFGDHIMTVKRSRISVLVFWGDFRGFPCEFCSFSFIFFQKSSFWAIFHICESAQNGGPGDFGDPGLTKFIKIGSGLLAVLSYICHQQNPP